MSDAITFYREFIATARETVNLMSKLETMKERVESDPALAQAAADAASTSGRPDISKADVDNAVGAITQILFTWDSGEPTQKSYFYELL